MGTGAGRTTEGAFRESQAGYYVRCGQGPERQEPADIKSCSFPAGQLRKRYI